MADVVEIVLALRNVQQFVSGSKQASGAIGKVGDEAERSGKKAGIGWKGMAKWAGGAAALYAGTRFIKSAVGATNDLAKSTITLSRTTGMDVETSSEWAALAKERGISTKQFQMSLVKLSKTMEASRGGTAKEAQTVKHLREQIDLVSKAGGKKAPAELAKLGKALVAAQDKGTKARKTLADLGVPLRAINKGDTQSVLGHVADALKRIENPAKRAALMQSLFGRSGQAMLPILMKGAAGVKELLNQQKESGNYLAGKSIDQVKKNIEMQRELKRTLSGVKIQLGTALLPIMVAVGKVLVSLARFLTPLTRNTTLLKIALAALVIGIIAYKAAMLAATIATTVFEAAAAPAALAVGAIVIAIAGLAIGFYLLYKHSKTFRAIVDTVWRVVKVAFRGILAAFKVVFDWAKKNWPLLLGILTGPIGLAVVMIIKHFDTLKHVATVAFDTVKHVASVALDWIKGNWPLILGILTGPFGLAVALIVTHFDSIKKAASNAAGAIAAPFVTAFTTVKSAVRDGLNFLIRGWNSLQFKVPGIDKGPIHFGGFALGVPQIPELASGGVVRRPGMALVGERGPELLALPGGAAVAPLPPRSRDAQTLRPLEINIPVMLDSREIARSTVRVAADKLARK